MKAHKFGPRLKLPSLKNRHPAAPPLCRPASRKNLSRCKSRTPATVEALKLAAEVSPVWAFFRG